MSPAYRGHFKVSPQNFNTMYDLFIELTDQLFWTGYAEQLAKDNPAVFQYEFNDFLNNYSYEMV